MKNIENLKNEQEIMKEINIENNLFDLKDFYVNKRNAAIIMISENKIIKSYSIISHKIVAEKLTKILDPEFIKFYDLGTMWQNQVTNRNLVCVQLCSNLQSLIWVPNQINKFQFEQLNIINNKFNTIKKENNLDDNINLFAILNAQTDDRKMLLLNDALKQISIKNDNLEKKNINHK